ncbi:PAS domain-containing sensor histidine kinase [Arthrobacter sp. NEB 688]|uniref:sensor histidine kinase n=1 Tax=Arthrobacter sp. NEB 688 TaxID=904039 RepID=UPI001566EBD5|nr:PAS domain-containing sensor histidine kinase [Arthrobacter sp. NEB 688]QKE85067.1 PAS domain-containing sensor histidine kinase [Arthrobacter sp. NEB 688]
MSDVTYRTPTEVALARGRQRLTVALGAALVTSVLAAWAVIALARSVGGPLETRAALALVAGVASGLALLGVLAATRQLLRDVRRHTEHLDATAAASAAADAEVLAEREAAQALARVGSWSWDPTTGRVCVSPEFRRILGLAAGPKPLDATRVMEAVHPDDAARVVVPEIRRAAETGAPVDFTCRVSSPRGDLLEVRVLARAEEQGPTAVVRGTLQDVTDERHADLLRAQFLSVVSHEMRTPLTSIRGALGLITGGAAGPASPAVHRMAAIALSGTERLVRTVNGVLDLERSRTGADGLTLDLVPVDLDEVIRCAVEEVEPQADSRNVRIRVTSAGPTNLMADPDRLVQAVANILGSAVRHSPVDGSVRVVAEVRDGAASIGVTDHGPLVSTASLATLFDHSASTPTGGRGADGASLGLSISRAVVEAHAGRLTATSRPDTGTTLTCVIPLPPRPDAAASGVPAGTVVADTDGVAADRVAGLLGTAPGDVVSRSGPATVSAAAASRRPTAVVTGDRVPGEPRWDLVERLRTDPNLADVPLVLVAGPDGTGRTAEPVHSSVREVLSASGRALVLAETADRAEELRQRYTDRGLLCRSLTQAAKAGVVLDHHDFDLVVVDSPVAALDRGGLLRSCLSVPRLATLPVLVVLPCADDSAPAVLGADVTETADAVARIIDTARDSLARRAVTPA